MLRRTAAFVLSVILGAAVLVVLPAPVLAGPAPNAPVRPVEKAPKPPKPPKPEITKVKPASGPTTGGTKVTVKGEHLSGATKVTFGKLKGTKVKVKSDHKLTVVAPAQASGKVDVRVKTKGGKSKKGKKARFDYRLQPPTVTGMTASTGPYVGGTRVTLTGTDFEEVAAVTFGATPGTDLSVVSPTQLAVTTPAHEAGTVPVAVTTSAGSAGAPSQFTFVAVPSAVTTPLPAGLSPAPGGGISLDYVSCSATPLCFAVGGVETVTGSYRPFVVRRTAPGAWAAAELPLPGDSAPVVDASFWDLECASPTLCVAVGAYATPTQYRGLALTWNGSTWSPHAVTEPTAAEDQTSLHSVDCPTATTCVVIGGYVDDATGDRSPLALTYAGATWSAAVSPPMPPSTSEADLTGVSCLSATQCVAVGYRYETPSGDQLPYVVGLAGGVWQVATVGLPAGATASPRTRASTPSPAWWTARPGSAWRSATTRTPPATRPS